MENGDEVAVKVLMETSIAESTDFLPNLVAGRPQAAPLFGRLLLRLQAETRDVVAVALWERRGAGQPRGAREPTAATPDGDGRGEGL
uniref:Uncharacterized protein n=1 Tax=Aegilops tauschii subsp. strangulata TaxID=200361 RepID=A0A453FRJ4_AEGTS